MDFFITSCSRDYKRVLFLLESIEQYCKFKTFHVYIVDNQFTTREADKIRDRFVFVTVQRFDYASHWKKSKLLIFKHDGIKAKQKSGYFDHRIYKFSADLIVNSEFYIQVDSDTFFIKDFFEHDFITDDEEFGPVPRYQVWRLHPPDYLNPHVSFQFLNHGAINAHKNHIVPISVYFNKILQLEDETIHMLNGPFSLRKKSTTKKMREWFVKANPHQMPGESRFQGMFEEFMMDDDKGYKIFVESVN